MNPIKSWMDAPAPEVTGADAKIIAQQYFGVSGEPHLQVAERDRNFRLDLADGSRLLLKVHNTLTPASLIAFQNRALAHIHAMAPDLPVPRIHPDLQGRNAFNWTSPAGEIHQVRMLSWLPGSVVDFQVADATLRRQTGHMLARLGDALQDCDGDGSPDDLPWDTRNFHSLRELAPGVQDPDMRLACLAALDEFDARLETDLARRPAQVIHNDFNPDNVLVDETGSISGVIDFGDMVCAPRIMDIAVAGAYQVTRSGDPVADLIPLLRGYHAVSPIDPADIEPMLALVFCRMATTVLVQTYRQQIHTDNPDYFDDVSLTYARKLALLHRLNRHEAVARIAAALEQENAHG